MTSLVSRLDDPHSWLHLPRPTARLRLTVLYGTLFTLAGTALLAFTYWLFDRATAGATILPRVTWGHACLHKELACQVRAQAEVHAHQLDLHTLLTQSGTR